MSWQLQELKKTARDAAPSKTGVMVKQQRPDGKEGGDEEMEEVGDLESGGSGGGGAGAGGEKSEELLPVCLQIGCAFSSWNVALAKNS